MKSPMDYLTNRIGNSFFLKPTNPSEIEAIILSLKNSKSVGPYSIPVKLLKILVKPVSNSFSEIVNASFGTGVYPTELKTAKVVALQKKEPVIIPQIIDLYLFYQCSVKLLGN